MKRFPYLGRILDQMVQVPIIRIYSLAQVGGFVTCDMTEQGCLHCGRDYVICGGS